MILYTNCYCEYIHRINDISHEIQQQSIYMLLDSTSTVALLRYFVFQLIEPFFSILYFWDFVFIPLPSLILLVLCFVACGLQCHRYCAQYGLGKCKRKHYRSRRTSEADGNNCMFSFESCNFQLIYQILVIDRVYAFAVKAK